MNVFKVVSGQLFHIIQEEINTGSKNFFKVQFVFDNSWEEYNNLRFAEFYQDINSTHYKIAINEEGIVNVPTEIICSHLPLYVGVSAENQSGEIIANTDFKSIKVNYGANTKTDKISYPELDENYYALFSPNTKLRYLRIEKGVLEYSSDNKTWYKVSSAISSGGLTEEEVKEIVTEATEDLPKDIDGSADEENFVLTVELKDKNGNVVSTKNIDLSFLKTDLADFVKFTDYATTEKAGVIQLNKGFTSSNGKVSVFRASGSSIDNRIENRFIDGLGVDYAVKAGITTNTENLTDEEKARACEWLGAIKKLQNLTGTEAVITIGNTNTVNLVASAVYANQIQYGRFARYQNPFWESDEPSSQMGMLVTNNPTKKYHCANKGWVEEYHAHNRNVFNITQIDTIYSSKDDLPDLGASGNGMSYLVINDEEKAIYSYSYDSESGIGTWTKKDDLKSNTTYVVLGGRSRGIFRYTMAKPYLIKAEQMQVVYVTSIDTVYESASALPPFSEYKDNGTEFIVIDEDKKERAVYSFVWNSDTDYYWYKLDDLREHSLYVVHGGEKKGIYRYTMASPYFLQVAPSLEEFNEVKELKTYRIRICYNNYVMTFEYNGVAIPTKEQFLSKINAFSEETNYYSISNGRAYREELDESGSPVMAQHYFLNGIAGCNNSVLIELVDYTVGTFSGSVQEIYIDTETFNSNKVLYSCFELARFM